MTQTQTEIRQILVVTRLLLLWSDQRCHECLDNGRLEIQASVLYHDVSISKRHVVFASLQSVVFQVVCR